MAEVAGSTTVVGTKLAYNSAVECSTVNRNVIGSNPIMPVICFKFLEGRQIGKVTRL